MKPKAVVLKLNQDGTIDWGISNLGDEITVVLLRDTEGAGKLPNCKLDGVEAHQVCGKVRPNEELIKTLEAL